MTPKKMPSTRSVTMKVNGKRMRIEKRVPAIKSRNHTPLGVDGASALLKPTNTLVAATSGTPTDDVASYLSPLERITNGPALPVLRFLLAQAKRTGKTVVEATREQISGSVNFTPRHVSRALAMLQAHGFLSRLDDNATVPRYQLNAVPVAPVKKSK